MDPPRQRIRRTACALAERISSVPEIVFKPASTQANRPIALIASVALSNGPKGFGKAFAWRRRSQLAVKLGMIRPPINEISMITTARVSRLPLLPRSSRQTPPRGPCHWLLQTVRWQVKPADCASCARRRSHGSPRRRRPPGTKHRPPWRRRARSKHTATASRRSTHKRVRDRVASPEAACVQSNWE